MIYRTFQDIRLSNLGMGAMRLPVLDGDDTKIDKAQTFRMVDAAMAGGVNYYDTAAFLIEQKRSGRIRHLGFSAHGSVEVIRRFLEAYGKDMEFCQLQLNWLDWEFQGGREKVALLKEWNIPVWVMEPLRGGKLAAPPEEAAAMLRRFRPEESAPGWAFRFVQSIPGVAVILSGMSNEVQMAENLRTFASDEPLNEEETAALLSLGAQMTKRTALPCTACIGCRSCEQVCPQQIRISEAMQDFCAKLTPPDQA